MTHIIGLAPMDGITNCAYRTITKELFEKHNTNHDLQLGLRTEFMNVEGFFHEPHRLIHHLMKTDFEDNTIAQIYGYDEEALLHAAKFIDTNYPNFAGIELNIGCPSPKVMSCGGGAGMLKDRERTLHIIKNIVQNIHMPFSIKTRCGLSDNDKEAQKEFILEASRYCKYITIHGRTYKQSHSGPVDWDFIYDIQHRLASKERTTTGHLCEIIGNGGIKTYEEAQQRLAHGNIMIGQAAIGRPRIYTGHAPTLQERYETIIRHAKMMIILFDYYNAYLRTVALQTPSLPEETLESSNRTHITNMRFTQPSYAWLQQSIDSFDPAYYEQRDSFQHSKTIIEYRKYLFNYIAGLPNSRELKTQLVSTKTYTSMLHIVSSFFEAL